MRTWLLLNLLWLPLAHALTEAPPKPEIINWCKKLDEKFLQYKWPLAECTTIPWNHVRNSNLGTPLIWVVFGDEKSETAMKNATIVMCGVHGDEITPVKFCFDLIKDLKNKDFTNKLVVVAPLVAPDSFFKDKPSRSNGRGVDVNRNFPTKDWKASAHKLWREKYKKDPRKFPGHTPGSEQEIIFQMNLIKRYKPNKIISVHAPLTLLDYDGPALKAEKGKVAKDLLEEMSKKSSGYKISNYPHFPGSLGNWAGKEQHIPTYTLELPNSNPAESDKFWELFKDAMDYALGHVMNPPQD